MDESSCQGQTLRTNSKISDEGTHKLRKTRHLFFGPGRASHQALSAATSATEPQPPAAKSARPHQILCMYKKVHLSNQIGDFYVAILANVER